MALVQSPAQELPRASARAKKKKKEWEEFGLIRLKWRVMTFYESMEAEVKATSFLLWRVGSHPPERLAYLLIRVILVSWTPT